MAATFSDGRFQVTWEIAETKKGSPLIANATALAPGYVGGFSRTSFEVPLEKTGIGYRVSIISWDPAGNGQKRGQVLHSDITDLAR